MAAKTYNVVALVSGGKDSCCSLMECAKRGHRIVAIANLHPQVKDKPQHHHQEEENNEEEQDDDDDEHVGQSDELDSFMYQTVGWNVIQQSYSQCLGVPLFCRPIKGTAVSQSLHYNDETTEGKQKNMEQTARGGDEGDDEVEDLFQLLLHVKQQIPDVQAVCSGAIFSDYQRNRVEHVLVSLSFCFSFRFCFVGDHPQKDSPAR